MTVVGSRAASAPGLARAQALGQALAERGALVISGGAVGIDAAAHRGALAAGGFTCAVLGSGVDVVYPRFHRALFADIVLHGCLLSAFPPKTPPRAEHFPQRNQVMAALADLVVVVEAQERSGTLYTARAARRLGRRVVCFMDLPGPAALSSTGATPVADVAAVLGLLGEGAGPVPAPAPADHFIHPIGLGSAKDAATPAPGEPLSPSSEKVLGALSSTPISLDEVCARTGLSAADCAAAVVLLELRGRCSRLPGGRYIGHSSRF